MSAALSIHISLGQPAMKLLHALGDEAAGPGGVAQASFGKVL
jgi:hypothetical protein